MRGEGQPSAVRDELSSELLLFLCCQILLVPEDREGQLLLPGERCMWDCSKTCSKAALGAFLAELCARPWAVPAIGTGTGAILQLGPGSCGVNVVPVVLGSSGGTNPV